jgi:hypothetical protein
MSIREAYKILNDHQEWRKGRSDVATDPKKLSESIDVVLKYVEAGISE